MDATDNPDPRMGDLNRKIEEVRQALLKHSQQEYLPVKGQVRECELMRELWRLEQEKCLVNGDRRGAAMCSKEARDWSTQQTRAIKQEIADQVYELEVKVEGNEHKRAKLGKLAVVK